MALHLVFGFVLLCSTMAQSSSSPQYSTNTTEQIKYVTPNESIPCGTGYQLSPCLTIAEYANRADTYFVDDSTFFFYPGDHVLNIRLTVSHIHNISFKGLPEKSASLNILGGLAGITWKSCVAVEISNIIFNVESDFTCILLFKLTLLVKLSNISILGNEHVGCSSIISERSRVDISNSKFDGIVGFSGAALITLKSTVTFVGNNSFVKNIAFSGGAMSIHDSYILFNGNNSFNGNTAKSVKNTDSLMLCIKMSRFSQASLYIMFTGKSARYHGGALYVRKSVISFYAKGYCINNSADYYGGAIHLTESSSMLLFGNVSFIDNDAYIGGAIHGDTSNIELSFNVSSNTSFGGNIILENNIASLFGGAIVLSDSSMQLCGNVSFIHNHASVYAGALFAVSSNISYGIDCKTNQVDLLRFQNNSAFSKSVRFPLGNNNTDTKSLSSGGAVVLFESSMQLFGNVNFVNNSAHLSGGAIHSRTSKIVLSFNVSNNISFSGSVIFERNYATVSGGAIALYDSSMQLYGNVSFVHNHAAIFAGALFVVSSNISYGLNCKATRIDLLRFQNNSAFSKSTGFTLGNQNYFHTKIISSGGAIALTESSMQLFGNVYFGENRATVLGGALYCKASNVIIVSISVYSNHSNAIFKNNLVNSYGGAIVLINSSMQLCGISFLKNRARIGGAIAITSTSQVLFDINSTTVYSEDSALIKLNILFVSNSAFIGAALYVRDSVISFSSNIKSDTSRNIFENNSANTFGGAIACIKSSMKLYGNVFFVKNRAPFGGAIYVKESNISFGTNYCSSNIQVYELFYNIITVTAFMYEMNSNDTTTHNCSNSIFHMNKATIRGGAIASQTSRVYFRGNVIFSNNTADYGGAIILDGNSKVILKPTLNLHFFQNIANIKGGAIYYHDYRETLQNSVVDLECFIMQDISTLDVSYCKRSQMPDRECFISFSTSLQNISLLFENNLAYSGGPVLYIGQLGDQCDRNTESSRSHLDDCRVINGRNDRGDLFKVFKNVSKIISANKNTLSALFADAEIIMFCHRQSHHSVSVYPGEKFSVGLFAVGPGNISVNTSISHKHTEGDEENIVLRHVQHSTRVNKMCTNVSYYVISKAIDFKYLVRVQYKLYHHNPCDSLVDGVYLIIDVKPCPLGFQQSSKEEVCVCDERLQSFTHNCYINTLSIERTVNNIWMSKQDNDSGLILHERGCPFDFCTNKPVNVSLSHPDVQCDFNRSGTLCGKCKVSYSLALGTLHCLKCTSSYKIALIVPFGLFGVVSVILILLLHLTVDVGTLNGLIFYVNIVHSNSHTFVPYYAKESNVFPVFIAWLNLDFGIETCFYDKMDIYTYSWLQFVFPFYIWFLIGAIIFISRYSKRMSKCLGQNPVAALATLLFVSYGKILNAIITPLSLTHLTLYSSNRSSSKQNVWLYDGSIEYLKDPKHLILTVFAIVILLVFFLPYTFLLLCGHWLMAYSDKCFLSWLNRIKPFMDVYYAPFKKEGRYWIGLVLLSRLALLLTIAINAVGSDSVNILVIASVTAGLLFIKGKVYEHNYNDILESSFIFNLCVLSIATFYLKEENPQSQYAASSVSIAFTLLTFLGILLFHVYLQLKSTYFSREFVLPSVRKCQKFCKKFANRNSSHVVPNNHELSHCTVTSTFVELREPLIDIDEA